MKKVNLRFVVFLFVIMGALALSSECYAQDAFTKLGRGVANALTGWVEIPKNVYNTSSDDNAFAGMTLGLAKGAGMGIVRTGAGLYEVATFPFALPEDYKPIVDPEYVF